jgi:hypothetical protein
MRFNRIYDIAYGGNINFFGNVSTLIFGNLLLILLLLLLLIPSWNDLFFLRSILVLLLVLFFLYYNGLILSFIRLKSYRKEENKEGVKKDGN